MPLAVALEDFSWDLGVWDHGGGGGVGGGGVGGGGVGGDECGGEDEYHPRLFVGSSVASPVEEEEAGVQALEHATLPCVRQPATLWYP